MINSIMSPLCEIRTEATWSGSGRCRILYIIGQLGWGGSERQLSYLLRELDRKRYPPAVLVWNYSPQDRYVEEIRSLGVPIYWFPHAAPRIAKLHGVRRLAQSLGAEVIHSYSFFTNFAAYLATLNTEAVAVGSLRGEFDRAMKDSDPIVARLSARWPQYQICNSAFAAQAIRAVGRTWSPAHVLPVRNGIDLRQFKYIKWCQGAKPRIVGVGSLFPFKRWDTILRVVQQVRSQGHDCSLTIAGDGPQRGSLERMTRDLGIEDHAKFIGPTSDVPELLNQSRLLVHASETEGCPNAVMEAMACGRPVVAMDAGDIPLLVENGKTGFMIRQGDEETFAQRVMQLLSDEELCRHMGLAARAKAEREFGLHQMVTRTLEAYCTAGWEDTHSAHSQAEPIHPR